MRISPSFLLSIDICVDDDDDDDFIEFGSQGLDYNAYINTYMQYKRKLGLYIKYIHTVKSASGAESSRVNTV